MSKLFGKIEKISGFIKKTNFDKTPKITILLNFSDKLKITKICIII